MPFAVTQISKALLSHLMILKSMVIAHIIQMKIDSGIALAFPSIEVRVSSTRKSLY
jgi:hypothetical protein